MVKKMAEQLTSIEHGAFDTAALQNELAKALEDDRLYKLTDNMKKRAIHTAANYDEFKNLVACADLKPLSQKELRDFSRTERQTKKKKPHQKTKNERRFQPAASVLDVPPATAVDFCRNWTRYLKTTDAKFRYLQITTHERLAEMFKLDIDSDLMADIIQVLVASWRQKSADENPEEPTPAAFSLSVVKTLAQTARFSLILDFFDDQQTEMVCKLFHLVESTDDLHEQDQETLAFLKTKFRLS